MMSLLSSWSLALTALATVPLADPWQREYTSAEAQSAHVIALWQFHAGAELEDSSGHGHTLELAGAQTCAEGRFGGGLQSFPGWPIEDVRHAAVAPAHPDLSPAGAFSIDLWLKPSPDLPPGGNCYLLCKKYVSHHDYQLLLTAAAGGARRLHCCLGFGSDSEHFYSDAVAWPADEWQHIAVTYDGAGTVRFYRNGQSLGGRTAPGRRAISPGPLPLSLGERTGSLYSGFAGILDQIRLSQGVREFAQLRVELDLERRVFVRQEPPPTATVHVLNLRSEPLAAVTVSAALSGLPAGDFELSDLLPGKPQTITFPLDTSLRPDLYDLQIRATLARGEAAQPGSLPDSLVTTYPIRLVARPVPDRMPVVQWGVGGVSAVVKELPRLKQLGFTHCLGLDVDEAQVWKAQQPQQSWPEEKRSAVAAMLDEALANDFRVLISLSPGSSLEHMTSEFARVDRAGNPLSEAGINGWYAPVQKFCEDVGCSAGQLYGPFPAFAGALIHTETRDAVALSYSDADRAAYRQATGAEIPDEVIAKWGIDRHTLAGFPDDGVIPDDHPLYRYLQWFWRTGDAWPVLNTATARGLKRGAPHRADLWTFHDPAVRVASVFGSGGEVDVLSQWTYSYPEPLRIGLPTDELLAMVRGASTPQRVMKMTQIIWYRSETAPVTKGAAPQVRSPWVDTDPDAAFITIAPMHLREAFWTKISRPIQGIMYHGWESLVATDYPAIYRYTHTQTQHELQRLVHEIVEPLGPMLRNVPAARHDVAFYESFAAQMFAQRGAYGWSHTWTGDCYQVLQHAGLQADVLYDESISDLGLDNYKVLVMPDADVLTQTVAERVRAFQQAGGIVVADDRLASAITPDIRLTPLVRTQQADVDKAALLALAATLRQELAGRYEWPAESSNPDIVPYRRTFSAPGGGASTYLFLVNDCRAFGQYVGQHGLVQEAGRLSAGTVTLRTDPPGSVVYDLVAHRRVESVPVPGGDALPATCSWPVTLGPCDGRLFLAVPRPISSLRVSLPPSVARGAAARCRIEVLDDLEAPVPAVLPLRVTLSDPDGRPAEYSGYHAAIAGQLELSFELARNDLPGAWHLQIEELASGLQADYELLVQGDDVDSVPSAD
ncbi:MAG: hypothetical protein GXY58_06155 [Planctomycetaceae bacterium]|nr:hypothetical protein [Planctomycetaceae bacterium]